MDQDNTGVHKNTLWIYIVIIFVLAAAAFFYFSYSKQNKTLTPEEQAIQNLRDVRDAPTKVQLSEEQKQQIIDNAKDVRSNSSTVEVEVTPQEQTQILNQLRNIR